MHVAQTESLFAQDLAHAICHYRHRRPEAPEVYREDGRVNYERVRDTDFFRRGLERLRDAMERLVVAMMCSEADPLDCHRGLLITPALREQGIAPGHLRPDGSVESTEEMEQRLLQAVGRARPVDGLFADLWTAEDDRQERAAAYREMTRRKAFRLRPDERRTGCRWSDDARGSEEPGDREGDGSD